MSPRRFIVLIIAAVVAIAGAMYLSSRRYLAHDPRGGEFLPSLNARLDSIAEVTIRKASAKPVVTLKRVKPGQWALAERGDYPADAAKVRTLLFALADAKVVEEKTSSPSSYAAIGVEDPSGANAGGAEVTLRPEGGNIAVIIGKPSGEGTFARRSNEAKSYAVEPSINVDSSPRDWIETKLLDIPLEKIRAIDVKLADGTTYSISRPTAKHPKDPKDPKNTETVDTDFALAKVPAGREAAEASTITPSPTSYSGVTADDVVAAKDVDFGKPATAHISLFDGGSYSITGASAGDKHWITVEAPNDPALASRTKYRAFEIASYRYDGIFRPIDQLLKPKPEKKTADKPEKSAGGSKRAKTDKTP
jgi:hypothetical protein